MSLFKKSVRALRNGVFLKKTYHYLFRRQKKLDGDWYYGESAEQYETIRLQQYWWHEENRILEDFLSVLPDGCRVLDAPVGTARFLPLYKKKRIRMAGVDVSNDMLEQAKRLRGELMEGSTLEIADVRKLPYSDNEFDAVVCFRLLESHLALKDVRKAIKEFCRVSKEYLILELGAIPQDKDDSELLLERLKEDEPIESRLSASERERFLKTFGLTILKSDLARQQDGTPHMAVYLCKK
jgi:ubiquinone/menaquinone biosynthesis C-methylase UbiE